MARKYTGSGGYEQPWLERMTFDRCSQPQAHRLVICKKLRVDHVAMSAAVYSCAKARLALPGDEPSGVVASADSSPNAQGRYRYRHPFRSTIAQSGSSNSVINRRLHR